MLKLYHTIRKVQDYIKFIKRGEEMKKEDRDKVFILEWLMKHPIFTSIAVSLISSVLSALLVCLIVLTRWRVLLRSLSKTLYKWGEEKTELIIILGLLMLCTAFVSAVLAIKIVAAHLYKTIDSYLDKHDAQIMDLIKWAKDEDKHQ